MRVGGPYIVEVADSTTTKIDNVFLTLGETLSLNLGLKRNKVLRALSSLALVLTLHSVQAVRLPTCLEDLEAAPAITEI